MWKLLNEVSFSVFILVFFVTPVLAMQSDNYLIDWDSINVGGRDDSTSENYSLEDTIGGVATGPSSSELYAVQAGYRQLTDITEPILSLVVEAEEITTEVQATAFNNLGNTVTVSDESGFAPDDYVGVVEDKGLNQLTAVGRVVSTAANTLTVDSWQGDNASMGGIDGVGDYVYKLSGNSVNLGTLTQSIGETGISLAEVLTNASNGYTVQIFENHDFMLGGGPNDIDDVGDGTVTGGNEEYGLEAVGADAQGVGDWAITSAPQAFAETNVEPVSVIRLVAIYKASKDAATVAGQYNHTVTYTLTGSF